MTTIRKSCRNCTASKRKCVIQLPKCIRCAQKGLDCMYDLEPVNAPTEHESLNPTQQDSSGYCIIQKLTSGSPDIDPAISPLRQEDALEIIRLGYHSVPDSIRGGKPSTFVHPKLQLDGYNNHLAVFEEEGRGTISYSEGLQRLLRIDVKTVPVIEALTAHQSLLIHMANLLFLSSDAEQREAEKHMSVLSEWAQTLLTSAQTRMPQYQSQWQEWLFGESVRRTILMSHILTLSLNSYNYGYCSNWLFVESLPFDKRAGLWVAESAQAWIAAAQVGTGEEVGQQLNSFHEFGESLGNADQNFGGDTFMALLAYGHNGVARNKGAAGSGS